MKNIFDYANKILNDIDDICDEKKQETFVELLSFLTTDQNDLEEIFREYMICEIDPHIIKIAMMLTIVSCANLVCEYNITRDINTEKSTEILQFLENLNINETIQLFFDDNDYLETIYELSYDYLQNNYIFRYCCWQNALKKDKMKKIIYKNPFILLDSENICMEMYFPKTEFTIQLTYNLYDKALEKAAFEDELDEENFDSIIIDNFQELANKHFNYNEDHILAFYLMIIGIVYESLSIQKQQYQRKYNKLIQYLENTSSQEILAKFLNNNKFMLEIIDLFFDFNDFLEYQEIMDRRSAFLRLGKSNEMKKFNPFFDQEVQTLKKMKKRH